MIKKINGNYTVAIKDQLCYTDPIVYGRRHTNGRIQ